MTLRRSSHGKWWCAENLTWNDHGKPVTIGAFSIQNSSLVLKSWCSLYFTFRIPCTSRNRTHMGMRLHELKTTDSGCLIFSFSRGHSPETNVKRPRSKWLHGSTFGVFPSFTESLVDGGLLLFLERNPFKQESAIQNHQVPVPFLILDERIAWHDQILGSYPHSTVSFSVLVRLNREEPVFAAASARVTALVAWRFVRECPRST